MTKEELKRDIQNRVSMIVLIYEIFLNNELRSKTFESFLSEVYEDIRKQYQDEGIKVDEEEVYRYTKEALESFPFLTLLT